MQSERFLIKYAKIQVVNTAQLSSNAFQDARLVSDTSSKIW